MSSFSHSASAHGGHEENARVAAASRCTDVAGAIAPEGTRVGGSAGAKTCPFKGRLKTKLKLSPLLSSWKKQTRPSQLFCDRGSV